MWALVNKTPYAAERNWIRDKKGVHWWLVAVRATFTIDSQSKLSLADEQLPPVLAPEHHGEPGQSSLCHDSDLLGIKPTSDVIVVGNVYAPGNRPVTSLMVALRIGGLEKQLVVHGERVYYDGVMGLATTKPQPFVTCPLRYEFAFGGGDVSDPDPSHHRIDERNPVGRGFGKRKTALVNTPAHTIEYPTGDAARRGPAGFGAIDRSWLCRRTLAGTYDQPWVKNRKPLLPDDYDPAYSLAAPTDQRLDRPLIGGEQIGLLNMSPEGAMVFTVPKIALTLASRFARQQRPHDPPMLTTLLLEPEQRRVSLVWQSALRVAAFETDFLDETVIEERPL